MSQCSKPYGQTELAKYLNSIMLRTKKVVSFEANKSDDSFFALQEWPGSLHNIRCKFGALAEPEACSICFYTRINPAFNSAVYTWTFTINVACSLWSIISNYCSGSNNSKVFPTYVNTDIKIWNKLPSWMPFVLSAVFYNLRNPDYFIWTSSEDCVPMFIVCTYPRFGWIICADTAHD